MHRPGPQHAVPGVAARDGDHRRSGSPSSGVLTYLFSAVTGRALGADQAAGLSTLWVVGFLLGNAASVSPSSRRYRARSRAAGRAGRRGPGLYPARGARRVRLRALPWRSSVVIACPVHSLGDRLFGGDWRAGRRLGRAVRGDDGSSSWCAACSPGEDVSAPTGRLLGAEAGSRVLAVVVIGGGRRGPTAAPFAIVLAVGAVRRRGGRVDRFRRRRWCASPVPRRRGAS